MVPRCNRPRKNIQAAPPFRIFRIGDVASTRVSVPAKEHPHSWDSDDPYQGCPKRDFSPAVFKGAEVDADFRKILYHSVQQGNIGILEPSFNQ